jgi:hypothetical protein
LFNGWVVSNTADDGLGSLRYAIANAAGGANITFSPALNGQTIVMGEGPMNIATNLTRNPKLKPAI